LDDGDEHANKIEYKSIIWSLIFLCNARLDICYAVYLCSRYMVNPYTLNLKETKRILSYVQGTIDFGIHYSSTKELKLITFSDSD